MKMKFKKSGGALPLVLIIVIIISVMSIGMMRLAGNDGVSTVYVEKSEQAFWLAESGMQAALHLLRTNATYRNSPYTLADTYGTEATNIVNVSQPTPGVNVFNIISTGIVRGEQRVLTMNPTLTVYPGSTNNIPPGLIGLGAGAGNQNKLNNTGTIDGTVVSMSELWVNGQSSPTVNGTVLATDGRNIDYQELTENDVIDISIDANALADFSLAGAPVEMTNMSGRTYIWLSGGITKVTAADLQPNGDFEIMDGIRGEGILIVPDLSGTGTPLKFSSAGADYEVGDNIKVWVDGDIIAQKDGNFGENVIVFTTGNLTLKKSATGEDTGFFAMGDITADMALDIKGLIYAEGDVQVDGDLTLEGSLIAGGNFWLKGGYDITGVPNSFFDALIGTGITVNTYAVIPGTWNEPTTL